MNDHLSDDQLLDRLYGVDLHPHAKSCAECAARFAALERRREELAAPVAVSPAFLAEQRSRISARLEQRSFAAWKWVPAVAATCALAVGVFVYRPYPSATMHVPAVKAESADAQLFSDVYAMAQSTEPSAAAPIHALFEENQ